MMSLNFKQKNFVVEIRVRGDSANDARGQEWRYIQLWEADTLLKYLKSNMRKSDRQAHLLMNSYDRFQFEVSIKSEQATVRELSSKDALIHAG